MKKRNWWFRIGGGVLALFFTSGCFGEGEKSIPEAVKNVEWKKYLGRWYEIARFPNPFQKKEGRSIAEYSLSGKGRIKVVNSTWDKRGNLVARVEGTGKFLPGRERNNGILRVSFQWPFYGEYRIIHLPEDYQTSIVISAAGKYLWILSRTPDLPEEKKGILLQFLRENGLDTGKLIFPDKS